MRAISPLPVDGADLTAPDAADRFRQQLIADVGKLLREHHLQIAQQVEKIAGKLNTQVVQKRRSCLPKSARDEIQKHMPRCSHCLDRGSVLSSNRTSRQEAPVAGQEMGRNSGLHPPSEAARARITTVHDGDLPDGGDEIQKHMPRCSHCLDRGSVLSSSRTSRQEAPVAGQETGRNSGLHPPSEAARARTTTVHDGDLLDGELPGKSCGDRISAVPQELGGDGASTGTDSAEIGVVVSRQTSRSKPRNHLTERWQKAIAVAVSNGTEDTAESASLGTRGARAGVRGVVDSPAFEIVTCMVIVSNSAFYGLETQFMAMGVEPGSFAYIASAYTGVFACELILRFIAAGREFFLNEHWLWNVIDTLVVATSLVEAALHAATPSGGGANLTFVRLIRVARIVRILRVVRVFQAFASLRILLYCVLHTLRSLMWTVVLLMCILYIFGILFTQAASEVLSLGSGHLTDPADRQSYEALQRYYGGLPSAIFTLFKSVTNGASWQDVSGPLSFVHPAWELLFTVFIAFTYFAVLNVVTGVFCQSAIESAANDKDMVLHAQLSDRKAYTEQLRKLFHHIDSNHSGQVDFVMLESCLQDPKCQAYFEVLGITSDDAFNLFMLLDDDDSDQIDLEEFVSGCLRLRGASRSIDSHMLLYESRWTMRKVGALYKAFNDLLEDLSSAEAAHAPPQPLTTDRRKHAHEELDHYEL